MEKRKLEIGFSDLSVVSGGARADRFVGNKLPEKQQVQYEHYYQVESIQDLSLMGSVSRDGGDAESAFDAVWAALANATRSAR
jgi:hypothetical protein